MKVKKLIKTLQKMVDKDPSIANLEVAHQDCYSAPNAFTKGTNAYVGEYFGTESSGYLDEEEADGEEITDPINRCIR